MEPVAEGGAEGEGAIADVSFKEVVRIEEFSAFPVGYNEVGVSMNVMDPLVCG